MQYSPKLKKAMEEIKGILTRYDINASILLHTPGYGEHLFHNASASSLKINEITGELRFRAKLQEDFGGDRAQWDQAVTHAVDFLETVRDHVAERFLAVDELLKGVSKHIEIIRRGDSASSNQEQNN